MTDPVSVIAAALVEAWNTQPYVGQVAFEDAETAVAALKANPDALAALLTPVEIVLDGIASGTRVAYLPLTGQMTDDVPQLYRIPEAAP